MSNWSHVAGIIRIDTIRGLSPDLDIEELIGKECRFDDPMKTWIDMESNPDKYLPMGSEGSLHMDVWDNPDHSSISAYTVSIFGDLRDHDSAQSIVDWFKSKCKEIDSSEVGWIRQAVITVENERNGTVSYTYSKEDN